MVKIIKFLLNFFLDLFETIITALAIFVIVYLFLLQPHQVKGNSMHSGLALGFNNGEYLLTNKIVYRFYEPKRDEVIVFKSPQNEDYDYIKRIIGLPNDKVKIQDGKVYINNVLLDEINYIPTSINTLPGRFLREGEEIIVPNDKYFVLGDNRGGSSDSREWGFVAKKNIIGKSWLRYWPLNRMGFIKKP